MGDKLILADGTVIPDGETYTVPYNDKTESLINSVRDIFLAAMEESQMTNKPTRFTPSDHAKLTAQLDKHNGQNVEYWSKRND